MNVETISTFSFRFNLTTKFQNDLCSINLSDYRDIEHNELKKNALIEQFEKITEAQRYTSEKMLKTLKLII